MTKFNQCTHNPASLGSYMVTTGSWNFFDQSMLPELFQCTAGLGTAFLMVVDIRENKRPYIFVPESVDEIPAIGYGLHDTDNFRRPDIQASHPLSANRLARADMIDFFQCGFYRDNFYHGIKEAFVAGFGYLSITVQVGNGFPHGLPSFRLRAVPVVDGCEYFELAWIVDCSFDPEHAAFIIHFDTYHQLVVSIIIT